VITAAPAPETGPQTIWLSGAILTALNKLILPTVWLSALIGIILWVIYTTGSFTVAARFRLVAVLTMVATGFGIWFTWRLQRVGYSGRQLVVSNYWREARIAFQDVEAVEPVWWYRGRMVRIRFRNETPFGDTVYYLPKWGPIRCLFDSPDQELRDILASTPTASASGSLGFDD
jgi:hypothetical protein